MFHDVFFFLSFLFKVAVDPNWSSKFALKNIVQRLFSASFGSFLRHGPSTVSRMSKHGPSGAAGYRRLLSAVLHLQVYQLSQHVERGPSLCHLRGSFEGTKKRAFFCSEWFHISRIWLKTHKKTLEYKSHRLSNFKFFVVFRLSYWWFSAEAWEGFKDLAAFEIQLKPMGFKRCPACQYPCEKADPLSCDHITCDLWMHLFKWMLSRLTIYQTPKM